MPKRRIYFREWRTARGLTLEQAAERMGITHATLGRIERGKTAYTRDTVEAMADAYGIELSALFKAPGKNEHASAAARAIAALAQLPKEFQGLVVEVLEAIAERAGNQVQNGHAATQIPEPPARRKKKRRGAEEKFRVGADDTLPVVEEV